MKQNNYIIYHDSCMDGFIAGMLTHYKAIYDGIPGDSIIMFPSQYGGSIPTDIKSGDNVTIVDFSYPKEELLELVKNNVNVTVVDHHKSFIETFEESLTEESKALPYFEVCSCPNGDKHSLFTDKIEEDNQKGKIVFYLSNNEDAKKPSLYKRSGAGLCADLLQNNTQFTEFLKSFARKDIIEIIRLAQQYDLWLHNGETHHDCTYLSFWFYDWYKEVEAIRKRLLTNPSQSNNDFIMLKTLFNMISFEDKIKKGKKLVEDKVYLIRKLCEKAIEVRSTVIDKDIKVGFIPGDDPAKLGISMTGSTLVKEFGYDVAIMEAKVGKDTIVYSLRSNQNAKNVDVSAICQKMKDLGIAITGGGHRNAAGVTLPYDPLNAKLTDKSGKFFIPV